MKKTPEKPPYACVCPLKVKFMRARFSNAPKFIERTEQVLEFAFEHGNCIAIEYITKRQARRLWLKLGRNFNKKQP
jgi:hypothetical protein